MVHLGDITSYPLAVPLTLRELSVTVPPTPPQIAKHLSRNAEKENIYDTEHLPVKGGTS